MRRERPRRAAEKRGGRGNGLEGRTDGAANSGRAGEHMRDWEREMGGKKTWGKEEGEGIRSEEGEG